MGIVLGEAWKARNKLRVEGRRLFAKRRKLYAGDELWMMGHELFAEGYKLRVKGDRLWDEGIESWHELNKSYIDAVIDLFESYNSINLGTGEIRSGTRRVIPFSELL